MATTTANSPGALLLRSSRMFSLPTTLKRPPKSPHLKASTTQTYPTTQSIETNYISRLHGDWGFKRPLPTKKTTNKTNSYVRINKIDTCEGITDFASANDHTISLRKWHEMGTPITMPPRVAVAAAATAGESVFEEHLDYTDIPPPKPDSLLDDTGRRWRYTGPMLGSISEGKFDEYLSKKVGPKREAFRAFVRAHLAAQKTADDRRRALEQGASLPKPTKPSEISDEVLMAEYRHLREDKHQLIAIMRHFLDLPPIQLGGDDSDPPGALPEFSHTRPTKITWNPWAKLGAPRMHPSVGMMYSRTASYLDNHPYDGPQEFHLPVLARVLAPATAGNPNATLGVGGWAVAHRGRDPTSSNSAEGKMAETLLNYINAETSEAGKLWVRIAHAWPTPNGKLHMVIDHANEPLIQKAREKRREINAEDKVKSTPRPVSLPGRSQYRSYARPGSSDSYGLGL